MTRKFPDLRRTDSPRCDPMSDTWLALIAHAGAIVSLFDLGIRFFGFAATDAADLEE
jgi:hypothetical protein